MHIHRIGTSTQTQIIDTGRHYTHVCTHTAETYTHGADTQAHTKKQYTSIHTVTHTGACSGSSQWPCIMLPLLFLNSPQHHIKFPEQHWEWAVSQSSYSHELCMTQAPLVSPKKAKVRPLKEAYFPQCPKFWLTYLLPCRELTLTTVSFQTHSLQTHQHKHVSPLQKKYPKKNNDILSPLTLSQFHKGLCFLPVKPSLPF